MKSLRKVDNVGKLFLSTCNSLSTNVFRLSCELNSPVDADRLNEALKKTVKCFPFFQVVIKKSLWWDYFEQSDIEPVVINGVVSPCAPIYQKGQKTLLYRVSCHDSQIHLDIFHALSDGAGTAFFLSLIVGAYLIEAHREDLELTELTDYFNVQPHLHEQDGFVTHYSEPAVKRRTRRVRSFQTRGQLLPAEDIQSFECYLPTQEVLAVCRSRNVSITELLTAVYIDAIHKTMSAKDERYPVTVSIPVNLRKYFHSDSMGNFFALVNARYNFSKKPDDLSSILEKVHGDLKEQLQPELLKDNFSHFVRYERNLALRVAPLIFKTSAIRVVGWFSRNNITSSFSNVGKVQMPEVFSPYIMRFSGFYTTDSLRLVAISYENELFVRVISAIRDDCVPRTFFSTLASMGLPVNMSPEREGLTSAFHKRTGAGAIA